MLNLITRYVRFASRRYKLVVFAALVLLLGSLGISSQLAVDSSLDSMLPEGNAVIDAMVTMEEEFGAQEHVIVVVKSNGKTDAAKDYLEALARRIDDDSLAANMMYKIDMGDGQSQYVSSESGSLFLMTVTPDINMANLMDERDEFFEALIAAIDETLERPGFQGLEAGVTGGSIIQDYESAESLADGFILAGILTLGLIIAVLILSFKRLFLPLTTVLPLLLGVALTAAFAAMAFGSLFPSALPYCFWEWVLIMPSTFCPDMGSNVPREIVLSRL